MKNIQEIWQAAQQQWQPIETAPTDRHILVKFNDYEEEYVCSCFYNGEYFEFTGRGHVDCNNPVSWKEI